jgi:hypothetical protein
MVGHTCELQGDSATLPVMLKAMTVLHAKPVRQAEAVPPGGIPPHEVALSSADSLWRVESCDSIHDSIHDPIHVPIHDSAAATEFATGPQQGWLLTHAVSGERRLCDSPEKVVQVTEFQAIFDLVSRHPHVLTLHAALLGRDGRGVLVVGPQESGKSTLATALWRRGWSLLCDDVAVINAAGVSAEAAPRRVSLRSGSRPLLGEELWQRIASTPSFMPTAEGCLFHPAEIDGPPTVRQPRLVAVVFLARRGVQIGPAEWRAINPAEALLSLAPYSNVVLQGGMAEALERLQPLANHVPAFDLGRGPLEDMIAAITRHVHLP